MEPESSPYRFGDMLALARRSWRLAMARELEARGHHDYRVSDAASMRMLLAVLRITSNSPDLITEIPHL